MGLKEENESKDFFIGRVLHVNCGSSKLGDVRTDQFCLAPGVKWADCHRLPFRNWSFDTVVLSNVPVKDKLADSQKWMTELARVAKSRILILNDAVFQIPGFRFSFFYMLKGKPKASIMTVYDRERVEGAAS